MDNFCGFTNLSLYSTVPSRFCVLHRSGACCDSTLLSYIVLDECSSKTFIDLRSYVRRSLQSGSYNSICALQEVSPLEGSPVSLHTLIIGHAAYQYISKVHHRSEYRCLHRLHPHLCAVLLHDQGKNHTARLLATSLFSFVYRKSRTS